MSAHSIECIDIDFGLLKNGREILNVIVSRCQLDFKLVAELLQDKVIVSN